VKPLFGSFLPFTSGILVMMRYLPIGCAIVAILGLTYIQIGMTDRFAGTNVTAEQRAELLKLVPKEFGDWQSEDKTVSAEVQRTAGALGMAISRDYRNSRTGEQVGLWLIVGHARDISAHTPNVCYPASGFEMRSRENAVYPISIKGLPDAEFRTNTFFKEDQQTGRSMIRVFWSWFNPGNPDNNGKVVWEAPENPRWRFGNTRALYKMYFTSGMRDQLETADQSACTHFAKEFLPIVDKILADVNDMPGSGVAPKAASADSATTAEGSNESTSTEAIEPAAEAKTEASAETPAEGSAAEASVPAEPVEPAKQ